MGAGKVQPQAVPRPPSVQTASPGGFASQPGVLGTVPERDVRVLGQAQAGRPPQASLQAPLAADPVLPQGTPRERYDFAFGLLRQANYDQAETALRAFLRSHGDDPLASNARYWLGETHYVRHEYEKAAQVFMEGFQKDPKGSKAPDSLLKLGMSLLSLEKKREACAAFEKLKADFPQAPAAIQKTMSREWQRSACE
jgi:tol-pal system protein YbgF